MSLYDLFYTIMLVLEIIYFKNSSQVILNIYLALYVLFICNFYLFYYVLV